MLVILPTRTALMIALSAKLRVFATTEIKKPILLSSISPVFSVGTALLGDS